MTTMSFYDGVLYSFIVMAVISMLYLFRVTAPYGRHSRGGFGPRIGATAAWVLMRRRPRWLRS